MPPRHSLLHVGDRSGMAQGSGRIPFRGDIEGLRRAATLIVLAYHAGVPFLSGGYVGLDIFFVMSGFLITALLVREAETTGGIRLRDFFARRIHALQQLLDLRWCACKWFGTSRPDFDGFGTGVHPDFVAAGATKQTIHRHSVKLASDVPEGHVDG